jgi:hypothetical protein
MATARPGQESGKTAETQDQIVHRWRDLRNMLAGQLDMFEAGVLTLRSNDVNVSEAAISDLKRSIVEFDALISGSR